MSLLGQYERARAAGNLLPWLLKNCPDGDTDSTLARLVFAEKNTRVLCRFLRARLRFDDIHGRLWSERCLCVDYRSRRVVCARCCDAIRSLYDIGYSEEVTS